MTKTKTNEEYLQELINKKIKISPLEEYKGSVIKILHKCICGRKWIVSPASVLKGTCCPICGVEKSHIIKTNHLEYLQKLINENIKIIPLENYVNAKTKILHCCELGHTWKVKPNSILSGYGCPTCKKKINSLSNKYTHEEYLQKLIDNNIKVVPLERYIDSHTKILHKCICGKEWNIFPTYVLGGTICKECTLKKIKISNTKTHQEYLNELIIKNVKVIPLEEYMGSHINIFHRCVCGNKEWFVSPNSVLKGHLCNICSHSKRSPGTHENYLIRLQNKNIKIYPLEQYKGNKIKILHKCICGNEWEARPANILNGMQCMKCQNTSKGNKLIEKFLIKNKFNYIGEYSFKDCKNKLELPFDFVIFDKENKKIIYVLEFDGEQHVRPVRFRGITLEEATSKFVSTITNDSIKNNYCFQKEINMIRIPYWQIKNIESILSKELIYE